MAQEGCGEGSSHQLRGEGQVLLEGAVRPCPARPCFCRSPRLGGSRRHRVLLRGGVAAPMPRGGGAAPCRAR